MWKKILGAFLALVVILGAVGWIKREAVLLYIVAHRDRVETHPNRPVVWDTGSAIAARTPNVVFILLDDVGIHDLSLLGDSTIKTPNIEKLAAEGALFTNAYAGNATCAPSRAALLTGRYATRTGFEFTPLPNGMGRISVMIGNGLGRGGPPYEFNDQASETLVPFDDQALPSAEITLAEIMKKQGYHTIHIGKWHLGRSATTLPNAQGFDESLEMASGKYLPEGHNPELDAKLDFDPLNKFLWARFQHAVMWNGGDWFAPKGYMTDYFTDEAVNAIEANKNRPFFLYFAHWGAHTPLQAAQADYDAVGDIQPHRARVYAAMLRSLDRSVGKVMDKLKAEGLDDNTVVILSSDNGAPANIGLPNVNAPYRGWKTTFFEGGIRVPLVIRWPGVAQPGARIESPVSHIDLMPTLVAATGGKLPDDRVIDGRDLTGLLRGETSVQRPDDAIYWSSGYYRAVRAGDWKLQVNGRQDAVWLFNLALDPTERTNLAPREPAKLAALQTLITAHWADAVPPLYPSVVDIPVPIDKTLADPFVAGDRVIYWPN